MSENNPQDKFFILSKRFALAQDIFGAIAFILAIFQGITLLFPTKLFLVISSGILVLEYVASHCKSMYFDQGHFLREKGLIDNSFNEKRIPNYDSEPYYNNASISKNEIKLLANIHENSLFTTRIAEKMSRPYYFFSAVAFLFFSIKLFVSGMDDYSSLLLSFIVSSSLLDRAMRLHSLKKSTEDVYTKINEICNGYEKDLDVTIVPLSQIIEVLLLYENALFESKIVLSKRIFCELNADLSKEWVEIRDNYRIYNNIKEMKQ
ncbi:hypothetical protein [Gallibacterium sp. ZY190522]